MATTVTIGGADATDVTVASATSLTCVIPAGSAAGTVDVTVTTSTGSGTLDDGFTYVDEPADAFTLSSYDLMLSSAQTVVVTSSEGVFDPADTFGYAIVLDTGSGTAEVSNSAIATANNATLSETQFRSLWFVSAANASPPAVGTTLDAVIQGVHDVGNGPEIYEIARLEDAVTVVAAPAAPTLTAISPTSGPATGTYTVTGSGFSPANVRWSLQLPNNGATGTAGNPLLTQRVSDTELTITGLGTTTAGLKDVYVLAGDQVGNRNGAVASNGLTAALTIT